MSGDSRCKPQWQEGLHQQQRNRILNPSVHIWDVTVHSMEVVSKRSPVALGHSGVGRVAAVAVSLQAAAAQQ